MALITLKEYAINKGKDLRTLQRKAQTGGFNTAKKMGNIWVIEEDEPFIDRRVKSGKYKDFRKK